jgi:hypothetical protein
MNVSNDRRNIIGQAARTNINWTDDSPEKFSTNDKIFDADLA